MLNLIILSPTTPALCDCKRKMLVRIPRSGKGEPQHEKMYILACALIENSDQPAQPRSLIKVVRIITKTGLFKYIENFTTKTESFQIKILILFIFFIFSNKKNNVYPCKPQFYYINVGF